MKTDTVDKNILRRFAENKFSRTEYKKVREWFAEEENVELKESLRQQWNEIPSEQELNSRLINLLDRLKKQISSGGMTKRWPVFTIYQKAAAVLFIPLLVGIAVWGLFSVQNEQMASVTIHSADGARTEFVLPDGSKGWLNSGSELSYPAKFSKIREVQLKGEAFFKVVHQKGKKFRVKTSGLTIQVLGTSFDISAYSDNPEISVILEKGSIQVLNTEEKPVYLMKPNERLDYNVQKKAAVVSNVDAANQVLWTQGVLQFQGEPLSVVAKELGRWYNVDIEIRDKQLQEYKFKATFKDEQVEEILRMIAITTPMKYSIEKRVTDENGIYKRKKIIIERK